MKCPVCKKEFESKTGRRPKKFCSDECKVKYWNAKKKVVANNKPDKKKQIEKERSASVDTSNFKQPVTENECINQPQFKNDIERKLWDIQQERLKTKIK